MVRESTFAETWNAMRVGILALINPVMTSDLRQIQHIAVTEQGLRTALIEDGARVYLRGNLECDAGRDIGLDQPGNDVRSEADTAYRRDRAGTPHRSDRGWCASLPSRKPGMRCGSGYWP